VAISAITALDSQKSKFFVGLPSDTEKSGTYIFEILPYFTVTSHCQTNETIALQNHALALRQRCMFKECRTLIIS